VNVYPPDWEGQHRVSDPAAPPPEEGLFARIEGLVGEEAAMLRIPAEERTRRQHERLRSIADELDRAFETLRDRARRLADGSDGTVAG
jgi:hypothetical protein